MNKIEITQTVTFTHNILHHNIKIHAINVYAFNAKIL